MHRFWTPAGQVVWQSTDRHWRQHVAMHAIWRPRNDGGGVGPVFRGKTPVPLGLDQLPMPLPFR